LRRRVADWWPRLADVDGGLLLAREGPVDSLNVGLQFLPPLQCALGLRRLGGGWFVPAAWGGWGSNPRPADYENYGRVHRVR